MSLPFRSLVRGVGGYLPDKVLTNAELGQMVDTSDEWITRRTGIRKRHIVADGQTSSDMATRAAQAALADAGTTADSVDLIVLATTTPDLTFPASATLVQSKLGMSGGAAFDVQAVCSGYIFALAIADKFLAAGQFKRALVIGAEAFSRIIDWSDRTTCVLFGDGAGALLLEAVPAGDAGDAGILGTYLRSDGRFADLLCVDGGPSSTGTVGHVRMKGNRVYQHAVLKICESIKVLLEEHSMCMDDIDWFAPHQANARILEAVAERLAIPKEKIIFTVAEHGNTSAASIPLALSVAAAEGKLKTGQTILMDAFGGGLTWSTAIVRL